MKTVARRTDEPARVVIFHRTEGWYPVMVYDDDDFAVHVALNPGTLRIEDADGNVLWQLQ